jgi:hypothetical protein
VGWIGYWLLSLVYWLLSIGYWLFVRAAVLAVALPEPVLALARAALLALAPLAPVLAPSRAALLAIAIAPLAPVLAPSRAAVLARPLPAPVVALPLRSPARLAAKPLVLLAAAICEVTNNNPLQWTYRNSLTPLCEGMP